MSLFNFDQAELLTFFAVLIRYSVLFSVLPFVGDKYVPMPVKILLSLAVSIALFPALVARGEIRPGEAAVWGATTGGIAGTVGLEVICGLVLGFTARLAFDAITFGGNLVGTFMGFATASTYDPHQESQSQVVAQIQMAIGMLIFLVLDGHHIMLRASLDSYRIVGLGGASGIGGNLAKTLIDLCGQVIRFGVLIAAPVAISLFSVNVAFGVIAKAMPQMNILVLSFAVSAIVGLVIMFLSMPEFFSAAESLFSRIGEWMESALVAVASGR